MVHNFSNCSFIVMRYRNSVTKLKTLIFSFKKIYAGPSGKFPFRDIFREDIRKTRESA